MTSCFALLLSVRLRRLSCSGRAHVLLSLSNCPCNSQHSGGPLFLVPSRPSTPLRSPAPPPVLTRPPALTREKQAHFASRRWEWKRRHRPPRHRQGAGICVTALPCETRHITRSSGEFVRGKTGHTAITTPHLVDNDSALAVSDTGSGRGREEERKDCV